MKAIPIHNPSKYGSTHCSMKRAAQYIAKGRAVMRPDGTLQFTKVNQQAFERRIDREGLAFDAAILMGRHCGRFDENGKPDYTVFWNGRYPDGCYPPGCNVQIERIPWRRSRYQHVHPTDQE